MPIFGDDGGRRAKEKEARAEGRLPPGQSLTIKWPVLHYGSVPQFDAAKWDFKISGLVETPLRLTWEEFRALPQSREVADFHCVTTWSRLDNAWEGVAVRDLMAMVKLAPPASHVVIHCDGGYTTNLPLEAFLDDELRLGDRAELLDVQQFVSQPAVDRLDVGILPWAAGLDVGGLGGGKATVVA